MFFRENPVPARELSVNLRSPRAFALQFAFVSFLGAVVYFAWPKHVEAGRLVGTGAAQNLFNLFFLGQYFLLAILAPTFAAGSITGEKERKTYELLLASPLKPSMILFGKLFSSMAYIIVLILSSLPLMILCYLLGGIALSEIARAYIVFFFQRRDVRSFELGVFELFQPDEFGLARELSGDLAVGARLRGAHSNRSRRRRHRDA